jgi:cadmium resistance protein CadD (predicted permease)
MSSGITLEQIAAAIGLAAVLFVATNIDDIFILLALFSNPSFRPAQVIAGQMVGMALVIALSVAGALLALVIAPAYVGLLGLVPLALGIVKLVRKDTADDDNTTPEATSGALRILAVTAITVANGADNIGVYVPMFATAGRIHVAIYALTMLTLTAVLCWVAHALIQHPKLGPPIRRFARPVTPFVLIALGIYILVESHAFAIVSPGHQG